MFGAFLGPFSILIVKAISATVPHPSQSSIALSDSSAVDSLPLFLGNASSDDPASGNALEITCDHILGSGFRVSSCRTLFPLMKKGTDEVVFADRTSPLHHDINLPFRVQSLDGKCYVEILLKAGKSSGYMDQTQFGTASYTLFDLCVVRYGYGGVAAHVGGDNNLQVVLASFKPNVRCDKSTPGPEFLSCSDILSKMNTSKDQVRFGRRAGPDVERTLPAYLLSTDSKCLVKIDSTTMATSTSSWYDIWQGINSIAYMCTKQTDFGGKAFKIGSLSTMTIEISAETPGLGFSNASLLNASSGEGVLLTLPAGAQNISSEEALLTPPSLPAPYLI